MSLLIDVVGGAIKTVSGARRASQAAGLDTPVLDELHDGLSPVRGAFTHARVHDLAANAYADQASPPTDLGDTGDGGPADADDGFISDATHWIADRIADLF